MKREQRVFLALELPGPVREGLMAQIRALKRLEGPVRWVRSEQLHVTLHFLGDQPADRIEALGRLMDEVAGECDSFSLAVRGLGRFGSRVVWAGVEPADDRLCILHQRLGEALRDAGFPVESRAWAPHITLGRAKQGRLPGPLTAAIASCDDVFFGGSSIGAVFLVQSHLSPAGASYSMVHQSSLRREG